MRTDREELHDFFMNEIRHEAWQRQLHSDFDRICFEQGWRLAPPLIVIRPLEGTWGLYNEGTRTISIAHKLIEEHPWHVVQEVFKHELAHLLVYEFYGPVQAHGREFREICNRLGLPDWASRASGAIPQDAQMNWKNQKVSETEEKLLQKVEKLLALAGSPNEHEALLAMQKVQELYLKYNLEKIAEKRRSDYVSLIINHRQKRSNSIDSTIVSLLVEHFFVRAIFIRQFDAATLQVHSAVEVLGSRENVLMAEYVYYFLRNKVVELWEHYQGETGKTRKSYRSYVLGILAGFGTKLKDQAPRSAPGSPSVSATQALMQVAETELEEFVSRRFPRLTKTYFGGGRRDPETFADGVSEGKKLNLNRPVDRTAERRGLLLEG